MRSFAGVAIGLVAALAVADASAQQRNPVDTFLARAKAAAKFDFAGTLVRVCVVPQTAPGPDRAPAPAPDRATWYTEPAKVFDNLYFVGTQIHSSWALVTSPFIAMPNLKR